MSPRGAAPRVYPVEVVEQACWAYVSGMTVREVQAYIGEGFRAQTILEKYLPKRRVAAKRDQAGAANHMWKGREAGYKALHLRVRATRGTPGPCDVCNAGNTEWANTSGDYADVYDFLPLCVPCHRALDGARHAYLKEVMPNA